ncbi:TlpA family protein disulfide reductase [Candidatus Korobacter versatilis]|nr:TlpA disulfide reductase family protein [Candidatus Koribacter versatilis]
MAIAIWILSAAAIAADSQPKPAPDFNLTDSEGKPVHLAELKGKVVLLNFWATWCHGCKTEMPWFVELQKKYGPKGLVIVGAAMDDDGWKSVKPYLSEHPLNYPVVLGDATLSEHYHVGPMPQSVLIARNGTISASYAGVVDLPVCEQKIERLLKSGS